MSDQSPLFQAPDPAQGTSIRELPYGEQPEGRLRLSGAEQLSNPELLAIIVNRGPNGACPLATASSIVASFGGLHGLSRASFRELVTMPGMGETKAAQLRAAFELGRRSVGPPAGDRLAIRNDDDVYHFLRHKMAHLDHEEFHVLYLNIKHEIMEHGCLYRGTVNSITVHVAELLRTAIVGNYPRIILAHNHPSGDPTPSHEDVQATRAIEKAADLYDIGLLDHMVIGESGYVSMRRRGLGFGA